MGLLSKHLSDARLSRIKPFIHGDLLDIGCQRGQLGQLVADKITSYCGVDISADAIADARIQTPHAQFVALNIDQDPLPFENQFDTIVMSALIEHIFNLRLLGDGLSRALKPGGQIVLTTPTPFGNDIVHRIGAMLGLFSKAAADDHIVIFNRKRCEIFANEFGLKLSHYQSFQLGCNQLAVLEK